MSHNHTANPRKDPVKKKKTSHLYLLFLVKGLGSMVFLFLLRYLPDWIFITIASCCSTLSVIIFKDALKQYQGIGNYHGILCPEFNPPHPYFIHLNIKYKFSKQWIPIIKQTSIRCVTVYLGISRDAISFSVVFKILECCLRIIFQHSNHP